MSNYLKYILMLLLLTVAGYFAHYLVINAIDVSGLWKQTDYSLVGLYTFGSIGSLLAIVFILLTYWAMPKNLGFVFLGMMTVKVIAGYIYIRKGLGVFENKFLEFNFLIVFFLYLIFDVYIAFQVLNQDDGALEKK